MTETRSAREQILATASKLFYQYGYRAVGVDTIIAESGVAKMTLYRHFPAKDDLIVAYLERSRAAFGDWLETLTVNEPEARKRLELIYEAVANRAVNAACLGCTFMAAALEFPEFDHPAHTVALAYKRSVLAKLLELSTAAGARDPQTLAAGLMLLMDGAWSAARMFGPGSHADRVSDAAKALIAAAAD